MTLLSTPIALAIPAIGETIEIDLATGTVTGTVATRREVGASLWQLVVTLPGGRTEMLTVIRADDGGWHALDSRSIGAGIAAARRIVSGQTLHGSVNRTMRDLADAVLALAGVSSACFSPSTES